jgi:hypothetical protein
MDVEDVITYEEDELDGVTCKLEDVEARIISLTV